jgi:hypothetical protein
MIEIIKILKVVTLGDFRMHLYFSDGTEGEWDFADVVAASGTDSALWRGRMDSTLIQSRYTTR